MLLTRAAVYKNFTEQVSKNIDQEYFQVGEKLNLSKNNFW